MNGKVWLESFWKQTAKFFKNKLFSVYLFFLLVPTVLQQQYRTVKTFSISKKTETHRKQQEVRGHAGAAITTNQQKFFHVFKLTILLVVWTPSVHPPPPPPPLVSAPTACC